MAQLLSKKGDPLRKFLDSMQGPTAVKASGSPQLRNRIESFLKESEK